VERWWPLMVQDGSTFFREHEKVFLLGTDILHIDGTDILLEFGNYMELPLFVAIKKTETTEFPR
jgi:hypothetical protein